jgi:hypothetical protein
LRAELGGVLYVAKVSEVWRLLHGGEVVAELHVTSADFPWLNAQVVRSQGFELVEPLFEDELRHLNSSLDEETDAWTQAYERIRSETSLTDPDGILVPEYLLHIAGDEAWWRWADEPFPAS